MACPWKHSYKSPPKGANLPYRPKPLLSPVYISGNQGFTVPATLAALPGHEVGSLSTFDMARFQLPKGFTHPVQMAQAIPMISSAQTVLPGSLVPVNDFALHQQVCLGPSLQFAPRPVNSASQHSALTGQGQQAQEMNIPNDLIGCIIGRGGQKINEIRQVSGATIKISNAENGLSDRKVTISGSPECIGLAQYLISSRLWLSMKLHKTLTLDPASLSPVSSVAGPMPHLSPHPMAMTVVKPLPPPGMLTLNGMASLNGVTQLVHPTSLGAPVAPASVALASLPASTSIMSGKPLQTKMRLGLTATTAFKAAERPKFSPY